MGNWSIVIHGIGSKDAPRGGAQDLVDHLKLIGQNVRSAEFISDTVEDSANLMAARDAASASNLTDKGHDAAQVAALVTADAARDVAPAPVEKPTETPDGAP